MSNHNGLHRGRPIGLGPVRHLGPVGCLAAALGALVACSSGGSSGGDHPDAGADPYANCTWDLGSGTQMIGAPPTQDNSADLGGAVLGQAVFDPSLQRRLVPTSVTASLPGLDVGPGYLTRSSATDESAYLTIPVANNGTAYPCFVQATYRWLGATGQTLNSTTSVYLDGSVGMVSTTIYTDTCLGPGESGYFIEIELAKSSGDALFSAVTSIELGLASTTAGTPATGKLLPTRYDVGTCSGTRTMRLDAAAGGARIALGHAAAMTSLGPVVFLDADGLPAGWTFVSHRQPTNLAPGTTTYFFASLTSEPSVSRARFFLPFDPPNAMFMSLPGFMLRPMQAIDSTRADRAQRWQAAAGQTPNRPVP